jgi:inner membrane protein
MENQMLRHDLPPPPPKTRRRASVTGKLIFIAILVVLLQIPLFLINGLQQSRRQDNTPAELKGRSEEVLSMTDARPEFVPYRMVERSLKYGVLVLVFTAFFLFETLCGLRLHAVHYGLVGVAMCLFYLALLALGEVLSPAVAYVGAAGASSALIATYSAAILRAWSRAGMIAVFLGAVHGVLYVVLRMESFALLAGTSALFVALAVVMYFTRHIDWHAQEESTAAVTTS